MDQTDPVPQPDETDAIVVSLGSGSELDPVDEEASSAKNPDPSIAESGIPTHPNAIVVSLASVDEEAPSAKNPDPLTAESNTDTHTNTEVNDQKQAGTVEGNQSGRDYIGGDYANRDINKETVTAETGGGDFVKGNVYNNYTYFEGRNPGDTRAFQEFLNLRAAAGSGDEAFWGGFAGSSAEALFQLGVINKIKQSEKGPTLRSIRGDWLADAVRRFVNFDLTKAARTQLRTEKFLVLQGEDDLLVYQIALWLIHDALQGEIGREVFPAYQVNMRTGLDDFIEADRYPHDEELRGSYFFAQNVPESIFVGISAVRLQQLKSNLEFNDNYLIVTVQTDRNVPRSVLGNTYLPVQTLPHTLEVINATINCEEMPEDQRRRLLQQIALRDAAEWQWLLPEKPSLKALYDLGEQICLMWHKTNGADALDTLFAKYQTQRVKLWFERHPSWEHRAYMVTLAVLDGALPSEIKEARTDLIRSWGLDLGIVLPPLDEMMAGQLQTSERVDTGLRRLQVNGFATLGFYGLILYHLWGELYREDDPKLDQLTQWLINLVVGENTRVRNLAARAIGTLANEYFHYIEEQIVRRILVHGALMATTRRIETMLEILEFLVTEAAKVSDHNNEEFAALEALRREIDQTKNTLRGDSTARQMADHYIAVLGNILAYGIESGNAEFKEEILEFIHSLTRADQQYSLIRESPYEIQKAFIDLVAEVNPTIGNLLNQLDSTGHFVDALIKAFTLPAINHDLTTYQQTAALAAHFYGGGRVVDRACKDIRRLTSSKNKAYLNEIYQPIISTFLGIIFKRLTLPGNPRHDIELIMTMLYDWVKSQIEKSSSSADHNPHLYQLGIDLYSIMAFRVTEPMTAFRGELRDTKNHPLLSRKFTDWPLLLYLALHSDVVEQQVTRVLRYLISKRDTFHSREDWSAIITNMLDTPKRLLTETGGDDHAEWTLRDQGYAILEYWMLFPVGRQLQDKATINRVQDSDELVKYLKRVVVQTLAWNPSDKTRARVVRFFRKHAQRRQTVSRVATELHNFVEDYTTEDGRPLAPD